MGTVVTVGFLRIREVDFHTLLTATAANATVTRTLTRGSANRNSLILADVPAGNAGDVKLSQDNGTTQVTLADGFNETELVAVTSSNPTLHLELTNSGDTARVYSWNHQEPGVGVPIHRWFRPVAATAETVGAFSGVRTLSVAPTSVDFDILVYAGDAALNALNPRFFQIGDGGNERFIEVSIQSNNQFRILGTNGGAVRYNVSPPSPAPTTPGLYLLSVTLSSGEASLTINGAAPTAAVPSGALASQTSMVFGGINSAGASPARSPLIAFRDNNGQLGLPNNGWNHSAITAFEGTL